MEDITINKIAENENLKKIASIVEKILNFNEQHKGRGLKTLTPKQMMQKLPIAVAQVKAANTSENLLNEIRAKQITKNECNNIINSTKFSNRMDTVFINY